MARVDALLVTALAEEALVARTVLERLGESFGRLEAHPEISLYAIGEKTQRSLVAFCSASDMGAVGMATFLPRILTEVTPSYACLTGIAATANPAASTLGDVPVAHHVLSYDDIAVEDGKYDFRVKGFPVDPTLRRAAGALMADASALRGWQRDCTRMIRGVSDVVNGLRRAADKVKKPNGLQHVQLLLEAGAGGPFLVRDAGFAKSLRKGSPTVGRVHPKLGWVEMEAHGFMAACEEYALPAIVIKGISDNGDNKKAKLEKATNGFFRMYACANATLTFVRLVERQARKPLRVNEIRVTATPAPLSYLVGLGVFRHQKGKHSIGFERAVSTIGPCVGLRLQVRAWNTAGRAVPLEAGRIIAPGTDARSTVDEWSLPDADGKTHLGVVLRYPEQVHQIRLRVTGPGADESTEWRAK